MLGDTEAVVNRAVAGSREGPGRGAHHPGIHAGDLGERLGAVLGQADESSQALKEVLLQRS